MKTLRLLNAVVLTGLICMGLVIPSITFSAQNAGDFDSDGDLDLDDIDALVMEIIAGTNDALYDLTSDGLVDIEDLSEWRLIGAVANCFAEAYLQGDANIDGTVNAADLNVLGVNWQQSPNTWSGGDFDASGFVDAADMNLLGLNWQQSISSAGGAGKQIGWEPLTMDFGVVPVGSTAYRTLTLTNTACGDLEITSVQFTFNQQDAFDLVANVPAILQSGNSINVYLSFTPPDFSFFLADLEIINNSQNAPTLIYSILGQGDFGNQCTPPLADCSGTCVVTSSDINNCGSCDNVCVAPANATAVCAASNCDFVCDDSYEPVGDSCQVVGQSASELLQALIVFANESVIEGTLAGLGPGNAGPQRLAVYQKWLDNSLTYIYSGMLDEACSQLNAAQLRTDGGWPFVMPPDFVAGEATAVIYERILGVMSAIDGCVPSEAPTRSVR